MNIESFLSKLNSAPHTVDFTDTISVIDSNYNFTPTAFVNGELKNEAGQNSGSCKIFSFAQQLQLDNEQTLNCFGNYYRVDVLQHPEASDHQNIRNFIKFGWNGMRFDGTALVPK